MSAEKEDRISSDLGFDHTRAEQDWDIVNSDPLRVREFLDYLAAKQLEPDDQRDMVALIVASIDDLLRSGDYFWRELSEHIDRNPAIHKYTLDYWADDNRWVSRLVKDYVDSLRRP